MISVRNVHRFFGDKHVLKDVSFDIKPGLMTGFVGGNGAGKTTTMRIILGVLAATEGQVLLDGEPITADNPLLNAPHCIINPHIAWATKEARERIMQITADNV